MAKADKAAAVVTALAAAQADASRWGVKRSAYVDAVAKHMGTCGATALRWLREAEGQGLVESTRGHRGACAWRVVSEAERTRRAEGRAKLAARQARVERTLLAAGASPEQAKRYGRLGDEQITIPAHLFVRWFGSPEDAEADAFAVAAEMEPGDEVE